MIFLITEEFPYVYFFWGGGETDATPFPIVCDPIKRDITLNTLTNRDEEMSFFYVLLTVHLSIILVIDQLSTQIIVL
jgi:hypothetical protein